MNAQAASFTPPVASGGASFGASFSFDLPAGEPAYGGEPAYDPAGYGAPPYDAGGESYDDPAGYDAPYAQPPPGLYGQDAQAAPAKKRYSQMRGRP